MIGIHEYILKSNESPRGFSTQGIQYLPYRLFEDSEEEYGYFEYDNAPSGELMLVPAAIVSDGGVERKRRFLRISDIIS